jgi:hypothetical protein
MADLAQRRRVLIMGAAGRDFHNFLCCYCDDPQTEVVAFTAAQIPSIAERRYPASLAGPSYPDGIPIYPETDLERLITTLHVDEVVFAYSTERLPESDHGPDPVPGASRCAGRQTSRSTWTISAGCAVGPERPWSSGLLCIAGGVIKAFCA